jgi:predicted nucleic acid-binding protein
MIIILDASAAIEIVLKRKNGERFLHHIETADWITSPMIYISEVASAFWKYFQFGNLSSEQCEKGIDFAVNLPDEFSHDKDLYREAFSLACQTGKPIYDMFYLTLTRRNNGRLMTLDKRLSILAAENAIRVIN